MLISGDNRYEQTLHCTVEQNHGLDEALDQSLIEQARGELTMQPVVISSPIRNVNRTVEPCSATRSRRWHDDGLPDGTITINFTGSVAKASGRLCPRV